MSLCVLLLAFIAFSPELGKVVVQTGVGAAEFYLDGNFVAQSDVNGNLTIESFPAGAFRFTVKKSGFLPYEGSFSLAEGETKNLTVKLQTIDASSPRSSKVQGARSRVQGLSLEERSAAQPNPKSEVKIPVVKEQIPSDSQPSNAAGDSGAGTWLVLGTLILLPVGGSLAWKLYQKKVRGSKFEVRGLEFMAEKEATEEEVKWAQTAPDFVEELKHKEDLIRAGFIGTRTSQFDRQAVARKEKEVVIVLPKEAYHYEEEK